MNNYNLFKKATDQTIESRELHGKFEYHNLKPHYYLYLRSPKPVKKILNNVHPYKESAEKAFPTAYEYNLKLIFIEAWLS